ncbi:MAG: hypothetical protein M3340_14720, partial [Actinomycetota bacterium]|nr:hypothetical protein [Actinomycetota bacterium]
PGPTAASGFADLPGDAPGAIRDALAVGPERINSRGAISRAMRNPFDFAVGVDVTFRAGSGRNSLLGRTRMKLAPRARGSAKIRLSATARKRLRRLRRLTVTQTVVVTDPRGGRRTVKTRFTLLAPRGR